MSLPSPVQSALDHQHEMLPVFIAGITDPDLRRNLIPGKWSAQEQVAHLCAYQPAFRERIRRILEEQDPAFNPYRAESDPEFPGVVALDAMELLGRIHSDREAILRDLSGLSQNQWQRRGTHRDFGSLGLATWVSFFLLHEAHHLFAILKITCMIRRDIGLQGPKDQ